jgi:NAD(P)-dependent dehydrogenase (short-subunit alcohol dehydrogenase family)
LDARRAPIPPTLVTAGTPPPTLARRRQCPSLPSCTPPPPNKQQQFVRQLLQRDGVRVVAAVRTRTPDLDTLAANPAASNGRLIVTPLSDVGDDAAVKAWARALKEEHKVERVGTAILNAGVYGERVSVDNLASEEMVRVYRTNTLGPLLCARYLREFGLIGGKGGAKQPSLVAAVSSKVGSVADNGSGGGYAYRASKAALNVAWKSLSIDLAGEGVKAVLLHPGYVRTRMTNGAGLIDVDESVGGMLRVLESGLPEAGGWRDYKNDVVPW